MSKVDLKQIPALTVAAVQSTGFFSDVSDVFMELFRWVLTNGGKASSYPMALFPDPPDKLPADGIRFEACIPVDIEGGLEPDGSISIRKLPEVTVAYALHEGGYGEVRLTYDRIMNWIEEHGYEADGPSRELYLTNPMQTPDGELVTEIQVPVKKSV